jgi:hypothetical protein
MESIVKHLMRKFKGYKDADGEKYAQQFLTVMAENTKVDEDFILKVIQPFNIPIENWVSQENIIAAFTETKKRVLQSQNDTELLKNSSCIDFGDNRQIGMFQTSEEIR